MKKDALFLLLTYAVLVPCASFLILSSPWSVTSKVICHIWFLCVCLSVVSLAILELLGTWSTTEKQDGLNRLAILAKKEKEILAGLNKTDSQTSKGCPCGHSDCDGIMYH
ncbi:hypothetical protein phiYeO3-12p24 [Yersinia phage phiYeO3-12]|uniref:4.2 protein n=1 Tax=Yersinia phage phiYeO3-12 TaxID=110457 RepID=Q9T126_9CAUD|nr:hypothetical protein phiYeO3-12p24 [Yersinia phage phiYeO3-12]CAB63611.1 4.2 protein [Yersinia phage phiYeO3-12]